MATKLAKIEIVRQDAAGNPIAGAVIELHPTGAFVQSGGPTSFTVDNPGSHFAAGLALGVSADGLTERGGQVSVASVGATNVTTASSITGMVNNDRIINDSPLGIFRDNEGNEFAGNSLTTDSNGYASGYIVKIPVDVESTGGTSPLGTAIHRYWFDVEPMGGYYNIHYDYPLGTAVLRKFIAARDLVNGDRFVEYYSGVASTLRWYVGLNASLVAVVPSHNVAGLLTIDSGGLTVTAGTITLPSQSLATTYYADSSVTTAKLAANVVHPAKGHQAGGAASVAVGAGETSRISVNYTASTGNVGGWVFAHAIYEVDGSGAGARGIEFRLYIGGVLKTRSRYDSFNVGINTVEIAWFEPSLATSSTTYEVKDIKIGTPGTANYRGDIEPGYISVIEAKR